MRLVSKVVFAALMNFWPAFYAVAEETGEADAARSVIQSQLDAFDDQAITKAYRYAAPNIQRIFPTPEVFGQMVRKGYPMIWAPSETAFLDSEKRGAAILQRLRVVDQAGTPFIAEYLMVMIDGEWRIAGVQIKKDDSYGV